MHTQNQHTEQIPRKNMHVHSAGAAGGGLGGRGDIYLYTFHIFTYAHCKKHNELSTHRERWGGGGRERRA